jgi:probable rRNA maturation factor
MDIAFEYIAEEDAGLPEEFFRLVVARTLEAVALPAFAEKRIVLNAVAVSAEKIRELNRTYRDHDKVTDILSFGEYSDAAAIVADPAGEVFIGELFFCPEFIRSAALEDGVSLEKEMAYIFSHGVLHLLGYDHTEEMFAIQDRIAEKFSTIV